MDRASASPSTNLHVQNGVRVKSTMNNEHLSAKNLNRQKVWTYNGE